MIDTVFRINLTHLVKMCEGLSSLKRRGICEDKQSEPCLLTQKTKLNTNKQNLAHPAAHPAILLHSTFYNQQLMKGGRPNVYDCILTSSVSDSDMRSLCSMPGLFG